MCYVFNNKGCLQLNLYDLSTYLSLKIIFLILQLHELPLIPHCCFAFHFALYHFAVCMCILPTSTQLDYKWLRALPCNCSKFGQILMKSGCIVESIVFEGSYFTTDHSSRATTVAADYPLLPSPHIAHCCRLPIADISPLLQIAHCWHAHSPSPVLERLFIRIMLWATIFRTTVQRTLYEHPCLSWFYDTLGSFFRSCFQPVQLFIGGRLFCVVKSSGCRFDDRFVFPNFNTLSLGLGKPDCRCKVRVRSSVIEMVSLPPMVCFCFIMFKKVLK